MAEKACTIQLSSNGGTSVTFARKRGRALSVVYG